jgi:hypothetical protein
MYRPSGGFPPYWLSLNVSSLGRHQYSTSRASLCSESASAGASALAAEQQKKAGVRHCLAPKVTCTDKWPAKGPPMLHPSTQVEKLSYVLSPLRGSRHYWHALPRLAPGATFFRRFAAGANSPREPAIASDSGACCEAKVPAPPRSALCSPTVGNAPTVGHP